MILITPFLILIGLVGTEFGVSSVNRAEISKEIRSIMNQELLDTSNNFSYRNQKAVELDLSRKLRALSFIDQDFSPVVSVSVLETSESSDKIFPEFVAPDRESRSISQRIMRIKVRVAQKGLFGKLIELPFIEEELEARFRT